MTRVTEIDGVPVLFAPAAGAPRAGLVFRAGQADETLTRRGLTRLVEVLATWETGIGRTGDEHTWLGTDGPPGEITGICAALRDLPVDRLAAAKDLLRIAAPAPCDLATRRAGARDFGLTGLPEYGLPAIGPDDVRDWAARYFTRGNAALWIAGHEIPAGLSLDLPDGLRRPSPPASSALAVRPAWFPSRDDTLAWDTVVRRGAAARVYAGLLDRVMRRTLRRDHGLSHTVRTTYEARTNGTALIRVTADGLPDRMGAVLGEFVDVLAALRFGRVTGADVAAAIERRCEQVTARARTGAHLPAQAADLLAGRPLRTAGQILAATRAVTTGEVAETAAAAWNNGLLMTPRGRSGEWAGLARARPEGEPVTGTVREHADDPDITLVTGADGVTLDRGGTTTTVRFDALAAAPAGAGDRRTLIGLDGARIEIDPAGYDDADDLAAWLDKHVPAAARADEISAGGISAAEARTVPRTR